MVKNHYPQLRDISAHTLLWPGSPLPLMQMKAIILLASSWSAVVSVRVLRKRMGLPCSISMRTDRRIYSTCPVRPPVMLFRRRVALGVLRVSSA